ncbi:MAG: septum formation initiator family protein [bacterium]|nr:septum formation initiator family protein [bacterium]
MSAARKYHRSYYDGNTVRRLEEVPDFDTRRDEQREEYERRRKSERKAKQRRLQRHKSFDGVSAIFFSVALLFTVFTAVQYLQAQQEIRALDKKITGLKKEVISIKDENGAIADSANNIDLEEIRKQAMERLGMVHPEDNQIINYDSAKKDYVKQYGDIPEGEKSTILDSIKKK